MAGFAAGVALGVILLLLGAYLLMGPYSSDRSYNMEPGQAFPYQLPSWYVFPLGTSIVVSWSGMPPAGNVTVVTCQSISSGVCTGEGPVLEYGSGSSGSLTFVASGSQVYGIIANSLGIVTVSAEYSSAYGGVLFLIFLMGFVSFVFAYLNYSRGSYGYRPI